MSSSSLESINQSCFRKMILKSNFAPQEIEDSLIVTIGRAQGCHWPLVGETRDASKHPTVNALDSPRTKNYPAPNINHAEFEKPALEEHDILKCFMQRLKHPGWIWPSVFCSFYITCQHS